MSQVVFRSWIVTLTQEVRKVIAKVAVKIVAVVVKKRIILKLRKMKIIKRVIIINNKISRIRISRLIKSLYLSYNRIVRFSQIIQDSLYLCLNFNWIF
jgi:hypothetical protein